MKDKDGRFLVSGSTVRRRWAEYLEDLLNVEDEREPKVLPIDSGGRMPVVGDVNEKRLKKWGWRKR